MASLAMSIAKSEFIVGGKYRLMRKIGSGSFGDIYLGINISNGEVSQPQASLSANLHDLLLDCCLPASQFPLFCSRFPFPVSRPQLVSSCETRSRVFPSFVQTIVQRGLSRMRRNAKRRRDMSIAISMSRQKNHLSDRQYPLW